MCVCVFLFFLRLQSSDEVKKVAVQCDSEVEVLLLRRRATRDNEGIRDDVMKSGVKQYAKLALKIGKASPQVIHAPLLFILVLRI